MYCLIYIFSDFIVDVLMFKKIFFWILPNSKKVRGTPVPTEYVSTVKNLTLTFWLKIFSWLPCTCIGTFPESLGENPNKNTQ